MVSIHVRRALVTFGVMFGIIFGYFMLQCLCGVCCRRKRLADRSKSSEIDPEYAPEGLAFDSGDSIIHGTAEGQTSSAWSEFGGWLDDTGWVCGDCSGGNYAGADSGGDGGDGGGVGGGGC